MNEKLNKEQLLTTKSELLELISNTTEKLVKKNVDESKIHTVTRYQIVKYVNLFNILYFTQSDSSLLKNKLEELLSDLPSYWIKDTVKIHHGRKGVELDQYSLDAYNQMLTVISLCILFDVSKENFSVVVDLIDRDNVKDFLFEHLIKYYYPDRKEITEESYTKFFAIPKMNQKIIKVLTDENQEKIDKKLKSYLNKDWYKTHKDCSWYNKHIKYPNSFYGYWAFEVAAIVKIKGLDHSLFKDNTYYPDKLV